MAHYFVQICPECDNAIDVDLGITSGLGPPYRLCGRCGSGIQTDRMEWDETNTWGKLWYVVISIIYVGLGSFFGVVSIRGAYHLWHFSPDTGMPLEGPGFRLGLAFGAVFVLLTQANRVIASKKRFREMADQPYVSSLLDLQVFLIPKVAGVFAFFPLVSWLKRLLLDG